MNPSTSAAFSTGIVGLLVHTYTCFFPAVGWFIFPYPSHLPPLGLTLQHSPDQATAYLYRGPGAKKSLPAIDPQFRAPLMNFIFFRGNIF